MFDYLDFNMTNWLDALAAEYRRKGFNVSYQPFVYPADFLPLAAVATPQLQNVVIDNDSDFMLTMATASTFITATPTTAVQLPNVLYLMTSATSQRSFQSSPLPLMNVFGSGERPHVYFKPLHFPAKSAFQVQLTNLSGTAYDVRLSFIGVKVYVTGSRS